MKQLLYIIGLCLFPIVLIGQSLQDNFEVLHFKLEQNVYDVEFGTKGMRFSFDYKYQNKALNLEPVSPQVSLYKNGMEVYQDASSILLLSANQTEFKSSQIFIPYRAINLLNGFQEEVLLKVHLDGLMQKEMLLSFQQPTRYIVEIDLKGGGVKRKLQQYDQSNNPKEWLPDPYYLFTSNEGTKAIYQSPVLSNTFELEPQKIKLFLLEGEDLRWSFYDRDGQVDQLLGVFDKLKAAGDYKDDFYGQMFGEIRNLEFTYSQRAQARQAISIYSDPNYVYKKKKGVAVTIEYDLARAYVGEAAQIHLYGYNKNGVRLDMPAFYAVEGTPEVGTNVELKVKGKLKYFIPFYVWKKECKDIEFYFEIKNEQQINAARHTLLYPFEFEDLVIDAGMEVQENIVYQGARGVQIGLYYELLNIYENAPLSVKFTNEDGSALPFSIYNIIGEELAVDIQQEHITRNPRVADRMSYFIPYASITDQKIKVQMDLIPDLSINMLQETTGRLLPQPGEKDVLLELVTAGGRFRADNYGQVLDVKFEVPKFFLDKVKLNLEVQKNGKETKAFLMDGYFENGTEDYTLKQDSGHLYLVFPHRNIVAGTTYKVQAKVLFGGERLMSKLINWTWEAPKELFNRNIEIALKACRFDKRILRDTSIKNEVPWNYVVEVGGEVLIQEPLVKKMTGAKLKEQFKQQLFVNREDNIIVKLVHKKHKSKVVLWQGDLGKWGQNDYKAEADKVHPVKLIKINTKVLDQEGGKAVKKGGVL